MKQLPIDEYYHLINHGPLILVTSGTDKDPNVAPIAWHMPVNEDPALLAVSIASSHHTSKLIKKYKCFTVNVPGTKPMIKKALICGKSSGKNTDKFKLSRLKPVKGKKIKTPYIDNMVGFIECKLKTVKTYDGVDLFVGKVVYFAVNPKVFDKFLIPEKAKTFHHIGSKIFSFTSKRFTV